MEPTEYRAAVDRALRGATPAPDWAALLEGPGGAALRAGLTPAELADLLAARRRCAICGHPLHLVVADALFECGGRPRRIRHLPHIPACSCGYAAQIVEPRWASALEAHFVRHPEAATADAADPALLALVGGAA